MPGRCRAGAGPCGPLPGARRPGAVVCQAGGGGCGPTCWSRPTSGASCGRRVGRVNSRPPWDARSAFRPHGCSDGGRPLPDERRARRSVSRETTGADPTDRRGGRQTATVVGSTPTSGVPQPAPTPRSTPPPGLPRPRLLRDDRERVAAAAGGDGAAAVQGHPYVARHVLCSRGSGRRLRMRATAWVGGAREGHSRVPGGLSHVPLRFT